MARSPQPARPRVLVIYKKSAYQIYVRERSHARVAALLEAEDPAVARLMAAHREHEATIEVTRAALKALRVKAVFRRRSDPSSKEVFDLVVTLGGDGTLLAASHMVGPNAGVLAINSAPEDSVGYFCAATREDLADVLAEALAGKLQETRLTRMRIAIDDQVVSSRVLNDVLFSHKTPAATTRYAIELDGVSEVHKSSGVWIATAAGSTAAIRSAGGKQQPITSKRLQYLVRECYAPSDAQLLRGFIAPGERLAIQSHIRAGCAYLDGPHMIHPIDIGSTMTMERSDEPLSLLGFRRHG
ncbi:MAG: NAD(+)/NADH kinase [Myxococcales bacterium]|nr:NAD(+)/NADH kinase [Myxococcales bacterium]